MEEVLGPEIDWPNYDEMNGRVFPSDSELFKRGEMIVRKKNGLFIEPYVSPYPPPEQQADVANENHENQADPAVVIAPDDNNINITFAVTDILTDLIDIAIKETETQ